MWVKDVVTATYRGVIDTANSAHHDAVSVAHQFRRHAGGSNTSGDVRVSGFDGIQRHRVMIKQHSQHGRSVLTQCENDRIWTGIKRVRALRIAPSKQMSIEVWCPCERVP